MTQEKKVLIRYRLERAHEALQEARILLAEGYANTFVNRVYYACFYAVTALLLTKDLSSARHVGVRALFHQNFVKPGAIAIDLGQLYDTLFRSRQKGDYADLVHFKSEEVGLWLEQAESSVKTIESRIQSEGSN